MLRHRIIPITAVAFMAVGASGPTTVLNAKASFAQAAPAAGRLSDLQERAMKIDDRRQGRDLGKLVLSLAAALATAEQHTGGRATAARFDSDDGAVLFEVEVANGNDRQMLTIDGANGRILKVCPLRAYARNGERVVRGCATAEHAVRPSTAGPRLGHPPVASAR